MFVTALAAAMAIALLLPAPTRPRVYDIDIPVDSLEVDDELDEAVELFIPEISWAASVARLDSNLSVCILLSVALFSVGCFRSAKNEQTHLNHLGLFFSSLYKHAFQLGFFT